MSKLIFNEREEPTEHWEIGIRTNTEAFSVQYYDFKYKNGYDSIYEDNVNNIYNLVVHNLSRLETILDIALINKEFAIKIQQLIHGIYS